MPRGSGEFSAGSSALGFFYQCRYALLHSLKRIFREEDFTVRLEALDDVYFEKNGEPEELLQTKHHTVPSNLTNSSSDLWKTLKIWSIYVLEGDLYGGETLYLVTTGEAPEGSAAFYLKPENRNFDKAINNLKHTAETSASESNRQAYQAFKSLNEEQVRDLISRIYVLDRAPKIQETSSSLREIALTATRKEFAESFLARLEGWWFRRVIVQLTDEDNTPVLSNEIDSEFHKISEQFHQGNLPIDGDLLHMEINSEEYKENILVKQLEIIGVSWRRIIYAIHDYFKAWTQRSRWLREDLLVVGDIRDYEIKLKEEWERAFLEVKEEIGEEAGEEEKKRVARNLFNDINNWSIPVRPNIDDSFLTRGSYHYLADRMEIGWHPDFEDRLKEILEVGVD